MNQKESIFKEEFESFSNWWAKRTGKSFYDLINKSEPVQINTFEVRCESYYAELNIEITSEYGKSYPYISFAMNSPRAIWCFLEELLEDLNETYFYCDEEGLESFFYCDEEGLDSFFYTKLMNNGKMRFVHISNSTGFETEDYKIRQDFIIDKSTFLNIFSDALFKFIDKKFKKESKKYHCLDDYHAYVDEADIFKRMYGYYKKD